MPFVTCAALSFGDIDTALGASVAVVLCGAGVALGDINLAFAWLVTHNSFTQLCRTQLFVTHTHTHTRLFCAQLCQTHAHTHNSFTQICHMQPFHTQLFFFPTQIFWYAALSHKSFTHTTLSDTTLSHTTTLSNTHAHTTLHIHTPF